MDTTTQEFLPSISSMVRKWRELAQITQAEAARKAGLTQQVYARLESPSKTNATLSTLGKVAKAMDIQLNLEWGHPTVERLPAIIVNDERWKIEKRFPSKTQIVWFAVNSAGKEEELVAATINSDNTGTLTVRYVPEDESHHLYVYPLEVSNRRSVMEASGDRSAGLAHKYFLLHKNSQI